MGNLLGKNRFIAWAAASLFIGVASAHSVTLENNNHEGREVALVEHTAISRSLASTANYTAPANGYKWSAERESREEVSTQWLSRHSNEGAGSQTEVFSWGEDVNPTQAGYRWGIRNISDQAGYRWGIRSISDQAGYRWGIRSISDQAGYRWGIRSISDQAGYRWGIRSVSDQAGYRWGIR